MIPRISVNILLIWVSNAISTFLDNNCNLLKKNFWFRQRSEISSEKNAPNTENCLKSIIIGDLTQLIVEEAAIDVDQKKMQPFAHYSFDRVEFTKSNVTIYVDVSEMQKGKWYNFIHIESDSIELGPQISAFLAQLNQTMREHNALSKLLMNLKLFNLQIFNLVEKLRPQTKDLHNAISEENVLEQFCAKNSNITDQEDAAEAKWSNKDLFDVLLASTAIKVDLEFVDKNINAADELINQMTQTEQTQA